MELRGAVALVTGGSGGLGAAICDALSREGVDLAVGYRDGRARAESVAADVAKTGRRALPLRIDQSDPASVEQAVAECVDSLDGLDLLINNAGAASGGRDIAAGDLEALTPEVWDSLVAVNFTGPYLVTRAAAPHLRASAWGRVVNLGSTIGHGPWHAGAPYAPSKAAVIPLTRFLAAALAPEVTVNCISPGLMEGTEMSGGASDAYVSQWRERALSQRTTAIAEVASQVVAFCKSASVTGQSLVMDGGIHFD